MSHYVFARSQNVFFITALMRAVVMNHIGDPLLISPI